jgi:hypothetical protein
MKTPKNSTPSKEARDYQAERHGEGHGRHEDGLDTARPSQAAHSRVPLLARQRAEPRAGVPPEVFAAGQGAEDEEAEPSKLPQRAVRDRNRRMVLYVIRWKAPWQSAVWCSNAEIPR